MDELFTKGSLQNIHNKAETKKMNDMKNRILLLFMQTTSNCSC